MPSFIFSADHATNQLTIPGHGLLTGDGPALVRGNVLAGALPGGLVELTNYWVIRVDANTLKLATSSTNANAGTAIDLTSAGSGTNVLEIGLPYRRATTYVPGVSPIKSADLNTLQDQIVGLHRDAQEVVLPAMRWNYSGAFTFTGAWVEGFTHASAYPRIRAGSTIASIEFRIRAVGDGISISVSEVDFSGPVGGVIAEAEGITTAGVDQTYVLALPPSYPAPSAGRMFDIRVTSNTPADNCRLYGAHITLG